jgi:DNA-binding FadR family transcriptional regulator
LKGPPTVPTSTRAPRSTAAASQRAIRDQIKQLILDDGLSPGDPMPTEGELMDRLDVGRNSLREALKALQAVGIVEIRHGFGTYVGQLELDALADGLAFRGQLSLRTDRQAIRELVEVRSALETGLVSQVIAASDPDSLALVADALAEMENAAAEGYTAPEADRHFHDRLYAPLRNRLLAQLLGAFWDVYHELSRQFGELDADAAGIAAEHREIFEAVRAGDVPRAMAATERHFDGIRQRIA